MLPPTYHSLIIPSMISAGPSLMYLSSISSLVLLVERTLWNYGRPVTLQQGCSRELHCCPSQRGSDMQRTALAKGGASQK